MRITRIDLKNYRGFRHCHSLDIDNGSDYEWSANNTTHQVSDIQKINKYSGFLEYLDILKTHLLTPGTQVNIFELLIKTLLVDIENPRTLRRTFGENWTDLNASIPKDGRHKKAISDFNSKIEHLNDGL